MSEHKSRSAGMSDHTRRGASSQLSVISEKSGASGNMSGGSKVPSHLSWAPMSNVSGGSTPHGSSRHSRHASVLETPPPSPKDSNAPWFSDDNARSAYQAMTHSQGSSVSRGSEQYAPSRHTAAPSHISGAAGPSGSHRTAAPMSMHSNMSGQSKGSSGSRQPERQMSAASGAGGQSSRHHSEAPMSQGSVMSRHGSHVSSSSRQSASPGSQHTSMTQHGGKSSHRSVVPSPLGQAPVHNGMRGSVSTSGPKPGETVEVNINIRTTRR
ncbi:hypothetical protein DFP73DRAFT_564963 [Morchella snyderi]|nr:hypothetical protein DFP73DRAFT_564963 [Morchella snyderi]